MRAIACAIIGLALIYDSNQIVLNDPLQKVLTYMGYTFIGISIGCIFLGWMGG